MATIEKVDDYYRLNYSYNGKRYREHLPKNLDKAGRDSLLNAVKLALARDKAGLEKFDRKKIKSEKLTVINLYYKVQEIRKNSISNDTRKRNDYALNTFIEIVGNFPIKDLKFEHFEIFKNKRYEIQIEKLKSQGKDVDINLVKTGINKDLENLKIIFNQAVKFGILSRDQVPKIILFQVDRQRLPVVLNETELILIENQLSGKFKLAFQIAKYTGGRRVEICRKSMSDNGGLKWRHVDWIQNRIRLYGKRKEKSVPMHPRLRELLIAEKNRLGKDFDPEANIIDCTRETLTAYFRAAMDRAGIDKKGSVHILRHSLATALLKSGANLREVQEFLGHSRVTTTEIYTHVTQNELLEKVINAYD